MDAIIDEIVAQKPHLAGPLRFYRKVVRFTEAVKGLQIALRPGLTAYPPESIAPILDHLAEAVDLPAGSLTPLRQAMELGEIDFTRLPLLEVPAFSLPYAEDDLIMLLFLASRPFFHALHDALQPDGRSWETGRCPLCRAQPSLSSFMQDGRRLLVCSFCGTRGYFARAQCPICLTSDPARMQSLAFTGEEGVSAQVCKQCNSYVKIVEAALLLRYQPDLADLASLPLEVTTDTRPGPLPAAQAASTSDDAGNVDVPKARILPASTSSLTTRRS